MKKIYLLLSFGLLVLGSQFMTAQTNPYWTSVSNDRVQKSIKIERKTEPSKSIFYGLNIEALKQQLSNAPLRGLGQESNTMVQLPNANGGFDTYKVYEAPVLAPELQQLHPEIRTYIGENVGNRASTIRISMTPQGLHGMILSANETTQYIDPYSKNDSFYTVYSKKDLPISTEAFACEFDDEANASRMASVVDSQLNANDGTLRTYRLALACTIEYSAYHVNAAGLNAGTTAQKKAAVLAAMVVTMNRVNGVYERDLSVTMQIVANNENIIFIDSDSFSNTNASALINESQSVIDTTIGDANYDIGHTFSTGGGGYAGLGVVCTTGQKGRGITGSGAPVGDAYDVDYVAHEMGHQFGATHTFNGEAGSCGGGNRTASSAYEPGSGTTIMAYAGICSPQNVQSNSDDYFHQKSLQMMWSYISFFATCAATSATGNNAPTAEAGASYTIPISTPYKLTGSSTDANGTGTHTFTWEQYDLGAAGIPTETTATGPLVRSFKGTDNPTRYVPRLEDLLVFGGSTTWEKLASIARPINYRLTVRDNGAAGGQTAQDNMIATTTAAAGPFVVTSQTADQLVWTPGNTETITWNVAGTTGNGVNTANVNILLSTDGGLTYDTVLASNTPNDGSQNITVPNVSAPYCRVMVEAVGNIFFNINSKFFAVGNYTYGPTDVCDDYLFTANVSIPEDAGSYTGYGLTVNDFFAISDFDINVNITTANSGDIFYAFRHPSEAGGAHLIASGICSGSANIDLTFDDEGASVNCASTNNGDHVLPQEPLSVVDGLSSQGQWIFFITDANVNGITSTLNTVTLTLCREEIAPILSTEDVALVDDDFLLFPNPNNGEFTIKFRTLSGQNKVSINVFDIRGRNVFNTIYAANGSEFNQTIDLGQLQSGMYLVNVDDGQRKITKKIVVE